MQHKLLEGTHRVTRPEVVELLRELVEVESPTGDAEGIAAIGRRMARELELLGGEIRFLDGGHVRADSQGAGTLPPQGHRPRRARASDAARTPELYFLAAKSWREALAEVLSEALPPDEAEKGGRAILRETALALYQLA